MTTTDQLLGQFIEAWNAGERPDVRDYLGRASEEDRGRLAELLSTWLQLAPTPQYDAATLARITEAPALRAALDAASTEPVPVAEQVLTLRERAGLGLQDVASRLARLFSLEDESRASVYLEQLERGDLDESRLSGRLLAGLAAILGADRDQLRPEPALGAGQMFFRSDGDSEEWVASGIDALSRAALAPAPSGEPLDELDQLFVGGPDA